MSDKKYEIQDKLKAAYALNMCTVSVSQIIDYNDEYILEQEYEAILNNLNLEQIPKDEALLDILVKLLNVITFFRIDKLKKERIEKKYQRQVKNAIWSAIPNIAVIVSGNPVSIAQSLATQVGIGYMNYRKEKANALVAKEDAEFELRITLMEQINALRRELFTTAWRLADEYEFPDRYRLTERQIAQYNKILMDTNEIRKYERLMSVHDKFEAYLPFWYFVGHTAKYIAEDKSNGLDGESRKVYLELAREHFDKYHSLNSFNILREDEIAASFALEYVDLLLIDESPNMDLVMELLETAVRMAGNANDILDLCAMSYLKIGKTEEAERLLRMLVNENYNTPTNTKLLSRIYVSQYLNGTNPLAKLQYHTLAARVAHAWLFPMPKERSANLLLQDKELSHQYISDQRDDLQSAYNDIIEQFIDKYIVLFNKIIPIPVNDASDDYFRNTESSIKRRRQDVYEALENDSRNEYRQLLRESGFRFRYIELLNNMLSALDTISLFRESEFKDDLIQMIRYNLEEASVDFKKIQNNLNVENGFSFMDYEKLQRHFSFENLTKEFFDKLKEVIDKGIMSIESLDLLDNIELDLSVFCKEQNLSENTPAQIGKIDVQDEDGENEYISVDVLGENEKDERFDERKQIEMLAAVEKVASSIVNEKGKTEILLQGTEKFEMYFKNVKLKGDAFKSKTLAVIDSQSILNHDLFITNEGIVPVKFGKASKLHKFTEIEYAEKCLKLGWPDSYSNSDVNISNLYRLLETLKKIRKGIVI
jgi:hypothetical protein